MSTIKIDKLSYTELVQLRADVDKMIENKKAEARTDLRKKIEATAAEAGLSLSEIFGKGSRRPVPVKYRDPKNPENTWTGRGRMPRWLTAVTGRGKGKLEDFAVSDAA